MAFKTKLENLSIPRHHRTRSTTDLQEYQIFYDDKNQDLQSQREVNLQMHKLYNIEELLRAKITIETKIDKEKYFKNEKKKKIRKTILQLYLESKKKSKKHQNKLKLFLPVLSQRRHTQFSLSNSSSRTRPSSFSSKVSKLSHV